MARLPRLVVAGLPHVVVHRGLNGQPVLLDDADRATYLQALAGAAREAGVLLHGYGLFSGEVRLLATPTTATSLGQMMQAVGRRYVRAFNQRHQRAGTPWEGRFRSTVLEPQAHFIEALRFVEGCDDDGTPLAGGTDALRWSSAGHHLGRRHEPALTEHEVFWALGNTPFEREAAYQALLAQPVPGAAREAVRDAALKGWALGSPAFVDGLRAGTSRRPSPLRRGRPSRQSGTAEVAGRLSVP
ncbi:MAG: transposase [Piscinibacter sp.]|uniref:transposase n=1 Tax=Piscinibacter sp. TaxID=1903157 RepID=UPI0025881467|nr:transposase [Piscinibacter sp.]MCW5667078.1 transposase [Piscinibacter sp.]